MPFVSKAQRAWMYANKPEMQRDGRNKPQRTKGYLKEEGVRG